MCYTIAVFKRGMVPLDTNQRGTTMKRNTTTSLKPRVIVGFNTATLAFSDKRRKSRKRVKEELRQLYYTGKETGYEAVLC